MPQQRQPYLLDPLTPQSPLTQRYSQHIYSPLQGFAELAGNLGEVYLKGRQKKKEEAEKEKDYMAIVNAYTTAQNPDFGMYPGFAGQSDKLDATQRASLATRELSGQTDPRFAFAQPDPAFSRFAARPSVAAEHQPGLYEAARGAEPPPRLVDEPLPGGGLGQRNPKTNQLDVRVQPDMIQTPGGFDARVRQAQASRPQTTVNLPPQENEYKKKRGQDFATDAKTYQDAGRSANKRLGQISVLEGALSDPAVYQGTAGNAVNSIKRAGKTLLGLDIEGVGSAEVAQKVGAEMALALKSNLPGPMSDSDRKFLIELPPGLSNSREGNIRLLEYQRRVARREMELATLARQYEVENGQLDAGFDAVAADYAEQRPLFTEKDFAEAAQLAASAPQPKPTAGTEQLLREADKIAAGALGK